MSQIGTSTEQAQRTLASKEGKYLTFSLGAEEY